MKRFFEITARFFDFVASCWNSRRSFSNEYSIYKPKLAVFVGSNSAAEKNRILSEPPRCFMTIKMMPKDGVVTAQKSVPLCLQTCGVFILRHCVGLGAARVKIGKFRLARCGAMPRVDQTERDVSYSIRYSTQ